MDININVMVDIATPLKELLRQMQNGLIREQVAQSTQPTVSESPTQQDFTTSDTGECVESVKQATPTEETVKTVDVNTVRDRVSELIRSGKKSELVNLLAEYGATGYSQLNSNDLVDFYNLIKNW